MADHGPAHADRGADEDGGDRVPRKLAEASTAGGRGGESSPVFVSGMCREQKDTA